MMRAEVKTGDAKKQTKKMWITSFHWVRSIFRIRISDQSIEEAASRNADLRYYRLFIWPVAIIVIFGLLLFDSIRRFF